MRKLLLVWVVLGLSIAALPVLAQGDAHIRVAHFSVDAGPVDVYVNGELALMGLEFGDVTSWYVATAGTYNVSMAPNATSIDAAVLGPLDVVVEADGWYTIAALGFAERPDIAPLTVQVIIEDFSPIASAETRVTMFHGIPNALPISVLANDTLLVAGLGYPSASSDGTSIIDVVQNTYDLKIQLTEGSQTVLFNLAAQVLTANRNYFIAVVGDAVAPELVFVATNPDTVQDRVFGEDVAITLEGDSHIRVAHVAFDAPAADVYINGELSAFTNIAYPAMSEWLTVPAGTYSVAIAPTGTSIDQAMIGPVDVIVGGGKWYTIAAIGLASRSDLAPLAVHVIEEDYSEIPLGESRFTVLHASAGSPPIDLVVNGQTFAATLAYPNSLGNNDGAMTFTVFAGTYDIQVTANGAPSPILIDLSDTNLTAGTHYLIAAINDFAGIDAFVTSVNQAEVVGN
ncbi:MAG: DUF4397 domain-containing protein [Phototrophicaceae bacterium]